MLTREAGDQKKGQLGRRWKKPTPSTRGWVGLLHGIGNRGEDLQCRVGKQHMESIFAH